MEQREELFYEILADRHGKEQQERLRSASVAIVGLGGLGSLIGVLLARMGVGRLVLYDFDRVDFSNIHRQQYDLDQIGKEKTEALSQVIGRFNPYITLELHPIKILEENLSSVFLGVDGICEAVDCPHTKAQLAQGFFQYKSPHQIYVGASGMAGFLEANAIKTKKIAPQFFLCGDFVSDISQLKTVVASRVALCASHQAHCMITQLLGGF